MRQQWEDGKQNTAAPVFLVVKEKHSLVLDRKQPDTFEEHQRPAAAANAL